MNIEGTSSHIGEAGSSTAVAPAGPSATDQDQVRRLAQEFEALLMTRMLRDLRRSMLRGEETDGFGSDGLTDTIDVELGLALSRAGGFGLTDALMSAFKRRAGEAEATSAAVQAPRLEDHAPPSPQPGAITSGFGWRPDPLTGARRFHSGVDIALSYGRDVLAAAEGRVAFSGERPGFGNTIVIEHGDGRQTRYAHLSEQWVQAGDAVRAGQVVGKSGDTGRTTGPHLHFEVLVHGRAVDPLSLGS